MVVLMEEIFRLCSPGVVMAGVMPFISGGIDTGDAALLREKANAHLKKASPYSYGEPIVCFLDGSEVRDLLEAQGFSHPRHLRKKIYEISVREIKSYPEGVKDDVLWLCESTLRELAPVVRDSLPCEVKVLDFGFQKIILELEFYSK